MSLFYSKKRIFAIVAFFIVLYITGCSGGKTVNSNTVLKEAFENARDGNWDKAKELSAKAVDLNPESVVAETLYAIVLEQCLESDNAVAESEQAVQLDSENFMAQYVHGRLLFAAQRYDECLAPLEQANKIEPNNTEVLLLLARTNAILDIRKKAIKYYIALIKHNSTVRSSEPFNELGLIFLKNNDFKRALQFFKEAFVINEKSIPISINLAVLFDKYSSVCRKKGKKAAAKKAAVKAIRYYKHALSVMMKSDIDDKKQSKIISRVKQLSKRARAS